MAKYLVQASYTAEGVKGLLKDGGTKRVQVVRDLIEKAGGKLESTYFAFGATDVFITADVPDHVSLVSVALTVGASGAVKTTTTVLLTPEDIDAAVKKVVTYTPPGQS